MQPIIHIGLPKTGTTWFQVNYFPFVENAKYLSRGEVHRKIVKANTFEFDANSISDELKQNKYKYLILSLEGLSGTVHNFGLNGYLTTEHAKRIKLIFPNAKIILFIRNQIDMIASAYIQYIKGGGTYSIDKYLFHKNFKNLNSLTLFSFKHFEYHNIITLYKNLFGRENVHIFLFEDFLLSNEDFIERFSNRFQFKVNIEELNYLKINQGYRNWIRWIALITNRFTERKMLNKYYIIHIPGWFEFSKKILNYANKYSLFGNHLSPGRILGKNNLDFISEYYKKSNQFLINEHQLTEIQRFNYPL